MKYRIGFMILIVLIAGCSAPAPDSPSQPSMTTTEASTPGDSPPPQTTIMESTGVEGEIHNTSVDDGIVMAMVSLTNHNDGISDISIALRFVENDSHAKIGEITLDPGETETLTVPLQTYADDPENLTVQLRINGEIVDEKAAV